MANLETTYLGLKLKNPIIVASSTLTDNLKGIERAYQSGAGAVVLRSLFEEQILKESIPDELSHTEEYDYLLEYNTIHHLKLIEEAKKSCEIPIIASVNCHSKTKWPDYAKSIEEAGADALELNIMNLPDKELAPQTPFEQWFYDYLPIKPGLKREKHKSSDEIENDICEIVSHVMSKIKIPVAVKLSPYITSLPHFAKKLAALDVAGLVLFNNFYIPDLDIETGKIIRSTRFSTPEQMFNTLRWIFLLRSEVKCNLSASTGVHDWPSIIKMVMAGADSVQLCSVLYKEGLKSVGKFLQEISSWMDQHQYNDLSSIRNSLRKKVDVNIFSRVEYMKMLGGNE